jgi:hypothetical protein
MRRRHTALFSAGGKLMAHFPVRRRSLTVTTDPASADREGQKKARSEAGLNLYQRRDIEETGGL